MLDNLKAAATELNENQVFSKEFQTNNTRSNKNKPILEHSTGTEFILHWTTERIVHQKSFMSATLKNNKSTNFHNSFVIKFDTQYRIWRKKDNLSLGTLCINTKEWTVDFSVPILRANIDYLSNV